jgi:hypothetical protein
MWTNWLKVIETGILRGGEPWNVFQRQFVHYAMLAAENVVSMNDE